ncbi:hypothetical protein [Sphingomonas endophytica]|uniref:Uncharacterized protein n=1 Tax=Sphingomonas endophytica TaxID=869719 RepID=A0A147I6U3_9SPHN|nr:hypothetical protein [Sphingomonas endophytica]KTT74685.1 hypothetical protein NS334_04715 [Sphingomonas endophytica]
MDSGSGGFTLEPISQDNLLVTLSLALVAVLAILTVIAMIWGARLKRQRRAAEEEEQRRIEALKADGVEITNTGDGIPPLVSERRAEVAAPAPRPAPSPASAPAPVETDHQAAMPDEPIAAAAPMDATPASVAADAPSGDAAPGAESVTILKGLGPKIATRLAELGITRLDQLAWLDDAEAAQLDAQLGVFQGRMERDRWREQARLLAKGDRAGYEAQFGKLG